MATKVEILADLPYLAPDRVEKLDLYLPARVGTTLRPGIVWIHGGGWTGGTKTAARELNICGILADAGYVVASIDYRLGAGAWPTNLHDAKNAVRFLRTHAIKYGIDPSRIAVAGGSAGGHLALLVGFTADQPEFEPAATYPGVSSRVSAIIDLYGPTDLLTRQNTDPSGKPNGELRDGGAAKFLGASREANPALWRLASPVTHVTKWSPPVLILHGTADKTVDYEQSVELAHVLAQAGVLHELVLLEGIGHTFNFTSWNKQPLPRDVRQIVLDFLTRSWVPESSAPPVKR